LLRRTPGQCPTLPIKPSRIAQAGGAHGVAVTGGLKLDYCDPFAAIGLAEDQPATVATGNAVGARKDISHERRCIRVDLLPGLLVGPDFVGMSSFDMDLTNPVSQDGIIPALFQPHFAGNKTFVACGTSGLGNIGADLAEVDRASPGSNASASAKPPRASVLT
jgi:hypothetical protein